MKSQLARDVNANLLQAYESFDAMDVWGLLRTEKAPLSLAHISERLGITIAAVQAALELLEAASLVRKLRAGNGRRTITYASMKDSIDVELPNGPDHEATVQKWTEAGLRHQEAILARMLPYRERSPDGDRFWAFAAYFKATDADFAELLRRMVAVTTFFREILDRQNKPLPEGERMSRHHAVFLRVAPVVGPVREGPLVKMRTDTVVRTIRSGRKVAPSSLAKRERQIASMLQRGLSRAEVAKRLGISVDTVSSHCKSIFKKLGIKRATELSVFSFETNAEGG